jgi:hypothetical protein
LPVGKDVGLAGLRSPWAGEQIAMEQAQQGGWRTGDKVSPEVEGASVPVHLG